MSRKIWFSSDWHLNHTNIAGKNVSSWKDGYRDFNSVSEMNETIIQTMNKYISWDDELWFLGDFCFKNHKLTPGWRNRFNCQTIHWIVGNHDQHHSLYKDSFSSVQHYWEGHLGGGQFVLMHYPLRSWHHAGKGVYHCYGHCHSKLEHSPNGRSMDVGIDNAYRMFGEYRPFVEEEVRKILDERITVDPRHDI